MVALITVAHNTVCSRRICPRIYIAEREIWFAASRLLWFFGMRPLPSKLVYFDGKNGRTPMTFRVCFEPRHGNVASLLSGSKVRWTKDLIKTNFSSRIAFL